VEENGAGEGGGTWNLRSEEGRNWESGKKKGGQWDNTKFLRGWEAEGIKKSLAILCNRLKSGDGSR